VLQLELLLRLAGRRLKLEPGMPEVPRYPLLAPWYRIVRDERRLLLEHGRSVVVVEGSAVETLLPALLPLLDGTRTVDDIVAELGARRAVERALDLLGAGGVLVEGPAASAADAAATSIAAAYAIGPAVVAERLRGARIGVVGASAAADLIARTLRASGVGEVMPVDWDGESAVDVAVVAPTTGEAPRLVDWNRGALSRGVRWLLLWPFDGRHSLVGPLMVPGETACYECVQLRLAAHLDFGADLRRIEGVPAAARATVPIEFLTAALAAQIALCWLGGADLALPGLLHVLETRPTLALGTHPVLRVPRCPACSIVHRLAPLLPWHEAELDVEVEAA
jgi:bacteriocin biosynthesis cyclodehydratase domain-containing protein